MHCGIVNRLLGTLVSCYSPVGKDLGLNRQGVEVVWHGVRGRKTVNLRQELDDLLYKYPKTSAILIHVGANDVNIGKVPTANAGYQGNCELD
jgi:hypothetical protein